MKFNRKILSHIIWRNKWNFILPLILIPLVALIASNYVAPVYRTSTLIWIGDPGGFTYDMNLLVGRELQGLRLARRWDDLRGMENELLSTIYINRLIEDLKLADNPAIAAETDKMLAKFPDVPREKAMILVMQARLFEDISLELAGIDQIRLTVKYDDPVLAQDIAQSLSKIFISEKTKQRMNVLSSSEDFSYRQAERYDEQLRELDKARTEIEREYKAIALDSAIISPSNRREIENEIDAVENEIEDNEAKIANLSTELKSTYSGDTQLKADEKLTRLENELEEHTSSISDLMLSQIWRSNRVGNFKARLNGYMNGIENEIESEVNDQFSSLPDSTQGMVSDIAQTGARLKMLGRWKGSLQQAYDSLESRMDLIPQYVARLEQNRQESDAIADIKTRIEQQQAGSSISQAILRESNFKIIEPARIPLEPESPIKSSILIFALILSVLVGAIATYLTEQADGSFRMIDDVEKELGLPVLGVIQKIPRIEVDQPD